MHTHVHRSTVHKSQEVEATQVPTDGRMDKKIWYIHTTEYYSALKNEILSHATNTDKP